MFTELKSPLKGKFMIFTKVVSCKVEKIYEHSLDSISSPSPSVKIQIIGGKVYFIGQNVD